MDNDASDLQKNRLHVLLKYEFYTSSSEFISYAIQATSPWQIFNEFQRKKQTKQKKRHCHPLKSAFTYVEMFDFNVFFQAAWPVGEKLTLVTLVFHLIRAQFRRIRSNTLNI